MSDTREEIENLKKENNRLLYQLNYQIKQKEKIQDELFRLRNSNSIKIGCALKVALRTRSIRSFHHVFKLVAGTLFNNLKKKHLKKKKNKLNPRDFARKNEDWLQVIKFAENIRFIEEATVHPKINLKVAIVTDEFMYNYYKDVFQDIFWLTPENYEEVLTDPEVDLLIYVSCWKGGLNDEWRGHVKGGKRDVFDQLISLAKTKGIKSVFQTIEDPSNFDHFLPLAEQFDWIFTSDTDTISKYKELCGHEKVYYLEYGVNPILNNPLGSERKKLGDAFFAGSYTTRYKERCSDTEILFDSILGSQLTLKVADRNHNKNLPDYIYPNKYQAYVNPPIGHSLLQNVHKAFEFNLNLNSIKYSPTMCAMRIYELQALNTNIVSNYSLAVTNKFPNINVITSIQNLSKPLNVIAAQYLAFVRAAALRNVLTWKTVYGQSLVALNKVGIEINRDTYGVALVKANEKARIAEQITNSSIVLDIYESIEHYEKQKKSYDFVVVVSDSIERFVVQDLFNGFLYSDADYVFKPVKSEDRFEYFEGWVNPKNYMIMASKFGDISDKLKGLAVDCFGILGSQQKAKSSKPKLSVIIPVYNNGTFIRDRCIPSLLNNKIFEQMELVIVDDGSTDQETLFIISDIEKLLPNVRVYNFEKGGSGTASRARNKGVEISSAEIVTFLDPDNRICAEGYTELLNHMSSEKDIDAVFGYQKKIADRVTDIGRIFMTDKVIKDPTTEVVKKKNFPAISTQCSVIKKRLLIDNDIDYIVGAIGQDTTYGYELLLASSKVKFINSCFIEYYADRAGSVTNTLNNKFFDRSLVLEMEQKQRLEKYDVWDFYKENRSEAFIRGWYLNKLQLLEEAHKDYGKKIVNQICVINECPSIGAEVET